MGLCIVRPWAPNNRVKNSIAYLSVMPAIKSQIVRIRSISVPQSYIFRKSSGNSASPPGPWIAPKSFFIMSLPRYSTICILGDRITAWYVRFLRTSTSRKGFKFQPQAMELWVCGIRNNFDILDESLNKIWRHCVTIISIHGKALRVCLGRHW